MIVSQTGPFGSEPVHRILHVFRAPVGGLFRHVVDLARLQSAAGHRVGIVCDSTTGGERAEKALAELAPCLALGVRRVPMRRNPHPSDITALAAVARRAETADATVLHGHGAKGGLYARLAPVEGEKVARAYTPHGGSYNYRPGSLLHRAYMAAERMLALRTDVFLFESAYVAGRHAAYAGGMPRLSRIVLNGLSQAEFEPLERAANPYDLVYVGELREAKGLPFLLHALARLRASGLPLRMLMVGSGPDEAILRTTADSLGLGSAVSFEPAQPIRNVLARGRIMVVPSLAESLPYVVLEAAAAAQPMVATNVGGIPEIFGAYSGDLVPPRDANALAEAIARIVADDPQTTSARFKALSASVRERFSLERMGAEVVAGYAAAGAPVLAPSGLRPRTAPTAETA